VQDVIYSELRKTRRRVWPEIVSILTFAWRNGGKPQTNSFRISGLVAEIGAWKLSSTGFSSRLIVEFWLRT